MNVSCPECTTIYRVDPARIPVGGVLARCARCPGIMSVVAAPDDGDLAPSGAVTNSERSVPDTQDAEPGRGGPTFAGASSHATARLGSEAGIDSVGTGIGSQDSLPADESPSNDMVHSAEDDKEFPDGEGAYDDLPYLPGTSVEEVSSEEESAAVVGSVGEVTSTAQDVQADRTSVSFTARQPEEQPEVSEVSDPDSGSAADDSSETDVQTEETGEREAPGEAPLPPPPFGALSDPHRRATRLARALVSDIVVYHPDRRARSLRQGTLRQEFREEIRKSWEEYANQVGGDFARRTTYFRDALNEILANGNTIF